MIRIKCPCCGYYTQVVDTENEPLFDICEVCFWQYDVVAHGRPEISIGANHISLHDAQKNFNTYGACKSEFKSKVRPPQTEELPKNNE